MTDSGLRAFASAGCGEKLTSLTLSSECSCLPVCGLVVCERGSGRGRGRAGCVLLSLTGALVLFLPPCLYKRAGLEGVTDSGLGALASAGCGEKLTSLTLSGECCCDPVCNFMVCGSGSGRGRGRAGCVLLSLTGALFAFSNAQG